MKTAPCSAPRPGGASSGGPGGGGGFPRGGGSPSWLGMAGLLAIGLGVFIPKQVERHMLRAQTDSNRQVLEALLGTRTLPLEDPESGFEELDRVVASAILRGDFVRVKLWSPDGRILYSDDRRLVGRSFPPSDGIQGALAGEPRS